MGDHHPFELFDAAKLGLRAHGVLQSLAFDRAGRQLYMLPAQCGQHIHCREFARPQRVAVEPDPDVAVQSSKDRDAGDTRDGFEVGVDAPPNEFTGFCRRDGDLEWNPQDGLVIGIEGADDRGFEIGGQFSARPGHPVPHLLGRDVEIGPQFEFDFSPSPGRK